MSDTMSGKTWVDTSPLGRPSPGRDGTITPCRNGLRRARFPLLDRGLVAFLALVGGVIWLFAGESNPEAAPHSSALGLGKHDGYVESLAFAPDGQTLASCGLDSMVSLWSVGCQGRRSEHIPGKPGRVVAAFRVGHRRGVLSRRPDARHGGARLPDILVPWFGE